MRGAIQVEADEREEVLSATAGLLIEMLSRNGIDNDDVVSVFYTVTDDITSVFPAEAGRKVGLNRASMLCAREIPVPGSMPRVVRILLHFVTDLPNDRIEHIYVGATQSLRDDIN